MKLYCSARSPFARKVRVFALETGLASQIEEISASLAGDDDAFLRHNPIGKIPALITDEGETIVESRIILEYLDTLHPGPAMIASEGEARWAAFRQEALADGVLDSSVSILIETRRQLGKQSSGFTRRLLDRIERCLQALNAEVKTFGDVITVGQIATGCTCGYVDLRHPDLGWREDLPELAAWYENFSKRPSMIATVPTPL